MCRGTNYMTSSRRLYTVELLHAPSLCRFILITPKVASNVYVHTGERSFKSFFVQGEINKIILLDFYGFQRNKNSFAKKVFITTKIEI